jgi:transcriptional regulator with XRE-family HTH domain
MSKITATQCAMARKCLRWSQENLASSSGVGLSTISSFEKANGFVPRASTIAQIRKTFEKHGIEFLEGEGVRRRCDEVRVYRDADGYDSFFDDMQKEIKDKGGDVYALICSNDIFMQPCGLNQSSILTRLDLLNKAAKVKCLIADAMLPTFKIPTFQIRQAIRPFDNPTSFCVYGDKYATIQLNGRSNFIFAVWDIPGLADTYKLPFLNMWDDAVLLKLSHQQRERLNDYAVDA